MSASDLAGLALLLVVQRAVLDALAGLTRLRWGDYRAAVPLGRLLIRPRGWVLVGLVVCPAVPIVVLGDRVGAFGSWAALGDAAWGVRLVAVVTGGTLAWSYSTYARNYHFDRSHPVERVVLVVLAASVWFWPVAVVAMVAVLLVVLGQFDHPSCQYSSRTPILLPLDLLVVAGLGGLLAGLGVVTPRVVVVALVACAASHYVIAGAAKVWLPNGWSWWLVSNRIDRLFVCAHANGWLARWLWGRVQRVAVALGRVARLLAVVTLALELGAGLMLADPRLAIGVLVGCVLLHTWIFLSSGILFWKWALADAALVAMIVSIAGAPVAGGAFGVGPMLAGLGVVAASPWIFRPVWLGWSDAGYTNHFEFEAVGPGGERAVLPRLAFAPYDIAFSQSRFHCLHDRPVLAGAFGAVTTRSARAREAVERLVRCDGSAGQVREIANDCGEIRCDAVQAGRLDELVAQRVASWSHGPRCDGWWNRLAPPKHIIVSPASGAHPPAWPIQRVEVRFVRQFYDGRVLRTIDDEVVRTIEIASIGSLGRGRSAPTRAA